MKEELRLKLKDQIPEKFKIESAMDYDNGFAKVRGVIGSWACVIEYNHWEDPDNVWLVASAIDGTSKEGPCPLNQLKNILSSLS